MKLGSFPALALLGAVGFTLPACDKKTREGTKPILWVDGGSLKNSLVPATDLSTPSREECLAATTHMKQIAPDEVSGDPSDVADCLKLPRAVVVCLVDVKSKDEADVCVKRYAQGGFESGVAGNDRAEAIEPETHASAGDCKNAMAHVHELVPNAHTDEALIAECIRSATASDIKCLLNAKGPSDVKQCGFDAE